MADAPKLDVGSLSADELAQIQNEVLRALAERAKPGGVGPSLRYDRHGSGHSKNSVMGDFPEEQVMQPDVDRPV